MSSLTDKRDTREILCGSLSYSRKIEIASGAVIYTGAVTAVNASGKAVPASDTAGLTVAGICEGCADGFASLRSGVFLLDNGSSAEQLSVSDIGKVVYALDDHTVGKRGGTNRVRAGILRDVTPQGVCVEIGNGPAAAFVDFSVATEDPAAAASEMPGKVIVVGGSGWSGTAISSATAGEVYMNTGSAWVKLG